MTKDKWVANGAELFNCGDDIQRGENKRQEGFGDAEERTFWLGDYIEFAIRQRENTGAARTQFLKMRLLL